MKIKCIKILAIGALLVLTGCNEINPDNYNQESVSVGVKEGQIVNEKNVEDTNVKPENPVVVNETETIANTEPNKAEGIVNNSPENIPNTTANTTNTTVYADYSSDALDKALGNKPVVLFFSGESCPNCEALNTDIKANASNFENAVILKADFASESELAKKFRVTENDTVVFVDKDGGSYNKKIGANINDIRNFLNTDR